MARKFNCQKCGWCCRYVNINVSYEDILRWSKEKRLDILVSISYIDHDDPDKKGFYITDTVTAPKKPCPFLSDDNSCTIYETRPRACAEFPQAHSKTEKLDIECPSRDDFELPPGELFKLKRDQGRDFRFAEDRKKRLLQILAKARRLKELQDEAAALAKDLKEFGDDPLEYLYPSSLGTERTAWTEVGTTPFLTSQDQPTNYIWSATKKAEHGDWSFDNTSYGSVTLVGVTLYIYGQVAASGDVTVYIYDGSSWHDSLISISQGSWGWASVDISSILDTWTKVDAAKMYVAHFNNTNTDYIDAAYLLVEYSSVTPQTGNFTIDAAIKKGQSGSITVNAVVQRARSDSFTIDATVSIQQSGLFTIDAAAKVGQAETFTVDATVKITQPDSFTIDAAIVQAESGSFTVDSVVEAGRADSVAVDAVVKALQAGTFSVDAYIQGEGGAASFTVNAVVKSGQGGSFAVDSFICIPKSDTFTVDAVIERVRSSSITVDASILQVQSGSIVADAVIEGGQSSLLTVDAVVRGECSGPFTIDATIVAGQSDGFTVDAYIIVFGAGGGSITVDAAIEVPQVSSFIIDAAVERAGLGSFTADAVLEVANADVFVADAAILVLVADSFTADAVLEQSQSGSFTVDAYILVGGTGAGSFTVNAAILTAQSGSFTVDSFVYYERAGSFTVDAILERVEGDSFTIDASLLASVSDSFAVEATIQRGASGSFAVDATISVGVADSITAGAIIESAGFDSFTVDTVVQVPESGSFTVGCTVQRSELGSFTADAFITAGAGGSVTVDAAILAQQISSFTVDAYIQTPGTGWFTVDAFVVYSTAASFTLDAIIALDAKIAVFIRAGQLGSAEISVSRSTRAFIKAGLATEASITARIRDYYEVKRPNVFTVNAVIAPPPWWTAAGVTPYAAFDATSAESYADSLIDLTGNGHDLITGTQPGWNQTDGWIFDGHDSLRYLITDFIAEGDQSQSVFVLFDTAAENSYCLFGIEDPSWSFYIIPVMPRYQHGFFPRSGSEPYYNGVAGIAGNRGYRDGVLDVDSLVSGYPLPQLVIVGAANPMVYPSTGAVYPFIGNIKRFIIYDVALTEEQAGLISAAMAA